MTSPGGAISTPQGRDKRNRLGRPVPSALAERYEQLFDWRRRLVLEEPDLLMYEPQPDGTMQLVAIEYVVIEADWQGDTPPMGQELRRKAVVGHQAGVTSKI